MSHLKQADHNREVCRALESLGHWDWVVTTAFYASVHYVEHRIFPFTDNRGDTHSSFDAYSKKYRKGLSKPGKHGLLSKLVHSEINSIASKYDWLKTESWTARYRHYRTNERTARTAMRYMEAIRAACSMTPPKKSARKGKKK